MGKVSKTDVAAKVAAKEELAPLVPTVPGKPETEVAPVKRPSIKYADLPLVSVLPKKVMQEAKDLLEEIDDLTNAVKTMSERREMLLRDLAEIQHEHNLPGLRFGDWAFAETQEAGRKTLSKEKLIEAGVSVKTLEACTVVGKEYVKKNFKNLVEKDTKEREVPE